MAEERRDAARQIEALHETLDELRTRCAGTAAAADPAPELVKALKEGLGRVDRHLVELQDYLSHQEAREAALEQDWFRDFAAVLPEGLFRADPDLLVTYANDTLLEMFGLDRADIEGGVKIHDFVVPGEPERITRVIAELIDGRPSAPTTFAARRKDGTTFSLEALGSLVRDPGGRIQGIWGVARDVTRHQEAIEALRKSEAEKAAILGNLGDMIIELIDPEMRIVWSNRPAAEGPALPDGGEVPRCHEVVRGRATVCTGCTAARAMAEGRFVSGEVSEPGGRAWITRSSPLYHESGELLGAVQVSLDVTERREEERVARIKDGLRIALSAVSGLSEAVELVLDAATKMKGVDSGCAYVAGGDSAFELVAPRGLSDGFVRAVAGRATDPAHGRRLGHFPRGSAVCVTRQQILDSPDPTSREEGLGSLAMVPMWYEGRPVAMLAVASHTEDEVPVATVTALEEMATDVASSIVRIKAEQARQEAVETLQAVIATAPLAIYILDSEGRIRMWNEAATRIFGWSESEVLGELPPFVSEAKLTEFRGLLTKARDEGGLSGEEVERVRKDGTPIFVRISASLLHDEEGRLAWNLTTAEDITQEKAAERDRERLSRLESLGVLAGGIAHEFNNLLMGIMGNISLVRVEAEADIREDLLHEAEIATTKAVALTHQLLTFSKGGEPVKEAVDLPPLVEEVAGAALAGTGVKVSFDLGVVRTVDADPAQISQALHNIIANAIEATSEGGAISIRVADLPSGDGRGLVEISVSDTGPGIAPEALERVFDPYFSGKGAGAGLGLTVAHSIVTRHGGKISVESVPGRGTTVRVLLPAGGESRAEAPIPGPVPGLGGSVDVLVVDDEDMVRKILIRMLDHLGYSATGVSSGDEAVRVFREAMEQGRRFGLVITDLTMPGGLGGIETAAELHRLDPEVKVLVSSGYSDDPAVARHEEYGFVGSVKKPYTLEDLEATLGRIAG